MNLGLLLYTFCVGIYFGVLQELKCTKHLQNFRDILYMHTLEKDLIIASKKYQKKYLHYILLFFRKKLNLFSFSNWKFQKQFWKRKIIRTWLKIFIFSDLDANLWCSAWHWNSSVSQTKNCISFYPSGRRNAFHFTRLTEEMHFVWPVWKKKHLSFCPSGVRNTFGFIAVWRNKQILFYPSDRKNTFRFANLMI